MAKTKTAQQKLGQVKLTPEERELIAANLDTPFFKLLTRKIMPSRVEQISVTCVSAAQNLEDLFYYKGRVAEAEWLGRYLKTESDRVDVTDFSNDDETIGAEDDNPNV